MIKFIGDLILEIAQRIRDLIVKAKAKFDEQRLALEKAQAEIVRLTALVDAQASIDAEINQALDEGESQFLNS